MYNYLYFKFSSKKKDFYNLNNWIIIKCEYGQLGNRLHTHANAIAWCLENNYNLLNLSFRPFAQYFKTINGRPINILIQKNDILSYFFSFLLIQNIFSKICMSDKWLNHLTQFIQVIQCDEDHEFSEDKLNRTIRHCKKLVVVKAWNLNFSNNLINHERKIRQILSSTCATNKVASDFINNLKLKYDIIIGVHARRGDYKEYLSGRHYHSWQRYKEWILQAKKLFEKNGVKKTGFVLCSDDKLDESFFLSLPVYFLPKKEIYTDIITLSLCHYNIGPPSSFGTWVSWYGKVPRCTVEHDTEINSDKQFVSCEYC